MKNKKIIFVSLDNTYTSVVAEHIAIKYLKEKKENINVSSKGIVVLFEEPANPKGIAIAKSRDINLEEHVSQALEEVDFDMNTIVIAMTQKIKLDIYDLFKNALNVYTLKEFLGGLGDIETPYGKSLSEYSTSFFEIEKLTKDLIDKLIIMEDE